MSVSAKKVNLMVTPVKNTGQLYYMGNKTQPVHDWSGEQFKNPKYNL